MTTIPAGMRLQKVNGIQNSIATLTLNVGTPLALGPTVAIAAKRTGSKIKVTGNYSLSSSVECFPYALLYKDGAVVPGAVGAAAGSRVQVTGLASVVNTGNRPSTLTFEYEDTAADTSSHTYELRFTSLAVGSLHINRLDTDSNSNLYPRSISTISAEEISV